ncbi:MAG: hypothetical protein U0570_12175 [Phycisphaerales bacterium]
MRYFTTATLVAAAALTLTGCLERKEKITVKPDGSASIALTFSGDRSDLEQGDAMPSQAGGWKVTITPDAKKPEEATLEASRVFTPGALAQTFATSPESASISLAFPTEIRVEERPDGTYYQFKRVYRQRADARYTLARRELQRDPKKAKLLETPPEELSPADRLTLVSEFRASEVEKQHQFILAGIAAAPALPQQAGIRILNAATQASDAFDFASAMKLLDAPASKERDAAIVAAANSFFSALQTGIDQAIEREITDASLKAAFRAAMAHEKADRAVTEDLNDESFEVTLSLPGDLVASNGETVDGSVSWKFDGIALMDRDQILLATSRVVKPGDARR